MNCILVNSVEIDGLVVFADTPVRVVEKSGRVGYVTCIVSFGLRDGEIMKDVQISLEIGNLRFMGAP